MADTNVTKVPAKPIVIPEHIDYGAIGGRITIDSGELKIGYTARMRLQVFDNKGVLVKEKEIGMKFVEYEPTSGWEILGVASLSFNSSPIPTPIDIVGAGK